MQIEYIGLSETEVQDRQEKYGKNIIQEKKQKNILSFFLEQFKSPLVYVLLIISVITFFLKDYSDTFVILIVVFVNAIVGTLQSVRTNNTIVALKHLTKPTSRVFRSGKLANIHTENIVVDDLVFIGPGDVVPSDGIIIEVGEVSINEATLTGESLPVYKKVGDEILKGSVVVSGTCIFSTKKIGSNTFIGNLSKQVLENVLNKTELEKKIDKLVKYILYIVSFVSVLIILIGFLKQLPFLEIFKTAVSLSVSAIPEGLPIILTIVLSLGAWRLTRVKALLKNLTSGGTLATVSYVCTDKTGTLTKGEIVLEEIINLNKIDQTELYKIINSSLDIKNINGEKVGDILDLKVLEKLNTFTENFSNLKESKELPFESDNKYNAKEYIVDGEIIQIYKGAPELFNLDKNIYEKYVQEGKRVLCIGKKQVASNTDFSLINVEPVAVLVFEDEIRPDVAQAVSDIQKTGVNIILITGDNILTANYVAKKVGILKHESDISVEGNELDKMSDEYLKENIKNIKVIARAKPDHKVRLVRILKELGEVVAMTGDGVNDGPAITSADIGISMGRGGTEVAREASDLVLVDDNFSNIVKAIFEARIIIENIKKTIIFLFGTSLGEIIIILGTLILGLQIALLPAQILWLNLITDGFLGIAIAYEKSEKNYSKQNYKRYRGPILNSYDIVRIIFMGATMGLLSIFAYIYLLKIFVLEVARSCMLVLMSIFQWLNTFNVRRHYDSVFTFNVFSNMYINIALIIEILLLYFSIFTDLGQRLLQTTEVDVWVFVYAFILSLSIIFVDEIIKIVYKLNNRKKLWK